MQAAELIEPLEFARGGRIDAFARVDDPGIRRCVARNEASTCSSPSMYSE